MEHFTFTFDLDWVPRFSLEGFTGQKKHYPPANRYAIHLSRCPISRS